MALCSHGHRQSHREVIHVTRSHKSMEGFEAQPDNERNRGCFFTSPEMQFTSRQRSPACAQRGLPSTAKLQERGLMSKKQARPHTNTLSCGASICATMRLTMYAKQRAMVQQGAKRGSVT